MKKITSLIIVFSMLVAMLACFDVSTAFAATNGNCGANFGGTNAKWSLNTSTGVLTISGKGATKDCGNVGSNQAPWKDSRDKIKSIVVEDGITALGRYMFYKCEVAESVSLPSTLTAIGDTKFLEYGTFVDCKALTNVTFLQSFKLSVMPLLKDVLRLNLSKYLTVLLLSVLQHLRIAKLFQP